MAKRPLIPTPLSVLRDMSNGWTLTQDLVEVRICLSKGERNRRVQVRTCIGLLRNGYIEDAEMKDMTRTFKLTERGKEMAGK